MRNTCWDKRSEELRLAVIASVGYVHPFDTTRHLHLQYKGDMVAVYHGKKKLWECKQKCATWKTDCCR